MEKFHGFENWLKANDYVSWRSYLSFMHAIEKELGVKDFDQINSGSVLQQLLIKLQNARSFAARTKSDRDNILSGFRTYILYKAETKNTLSKSN